MTALHALAIAAGWSIAIIAIFAAITGIAMLLGAFIRIGDPSGDHQPEHDARDMYAEDFGRLTDAALIQQIHDGSTSDV